MRIFIHTPTGKKFPLEAERSDTIGHVKGLIEEKEGIRRSKQTLICGGRQLEDSKTLRNYYYIGNESILQMVGGGILFHIKTSPGNPFTILLRSKHPLVDDVKAEIKQRMGIPVNEQRLVFSGKELDDGERTIIKYYGVPADSTIRLVRLPTPDAAEKGTGDQHEEDSSSATPPRHFEGLLSTCGAMRVQGMESFWDEEEFGLAWRKSRSLITPYETSRFEYKNPRVLVEFVANECVQTLNVMAIMESQLQEYKDKLSRTKNELKRLSERNAGMEDSLHKEKECVKKVMQELDVERSTGTSFLISDVGQRSLVTLKRQAAKSAVDEFKKSVTIKNLVMDRATSVYEDTVKECQSLLRKSGRVSEDIIQLIGPQYEQ